MRKPDFSYRVFTLLGFFLLSYKLEAQEPQLIIDYNASKTDSLITDLKHNILIIINSLDNNSIITITDVLGEPLNIDRNNFSQFNFNNTEHSVSILLEANGDKVNIGGKSLESGNLTISRFPDIVLFKIKKNIQETGNTVTNDDYNPTGYAFKDALTIFKTEDINNCLSIFSYYLYTLNGSSERIKNKDDLVSALGKSNNNYLEDNQLEALVSSKKDGTVSSGAKGAITLKSISSSVGGLGITTIADGFAKFIVNRTKQELNIAFFNKFKEDLEELLDLQTLFPQTYRAMNAIGEDIYMFEAYIQTLRESFENDLATLPSNLPGIIDNHAEYFNKNPKFKSELLSAFYVAQALQDKQHPGEIIENYPVEVLDSLQNAKAAVQTLQLFSYSLKNDKDTSYWIPYVELKKLTADETLLKLYLGFLVQQARNNGIVFMENKKSVLFADKMNEAYKDLRPVKNYLRNLTTKTQALEAKIRQLKKTTNDSLMFENYYGVISLSFDMMGYALKVDTLSFFSKGSLQLKDKINSILDIAQAASDIVIDVNRRNYSSAIVNVGYILDHALKEYSDKQTTPAEIKVKIFKYGSFMAAIVQAKSPDEVESVIEAIALPTGSARIKRETVFNVSVNAYCGIYTGYEKIKTIDMGANEINFNFKKNWNSYGLTAPIGLAISLGKQQCLPFVTGSRYNGHWSHTLFFSFVDIGALASFRFKNDSTSSVPEIQLKNIISPGIFYSLGIPRSPVSINIGWQFGPLLREVTPEINNYSDKYTRFSISLCVDIPLFNFYTLSKN